MKVEESFKKFLEIVEKEENFFLTTHLNPDLDGVSAVLAFFYFLLEKGKKVTAVVEKLPRTAKFLKGINHIKEESEVSEVEPEKVAVVFDANGVSRLTEAIQKLTEVCKYVVIFDHHYLEDNRKPFSKERLLIVDPEAPSTTTLLYRFFEYIGFTPSKEVAECLLAGLYFDTGGFRFENSKEEAFEVAKALVRLGASPSKIAREIFENIPFEEVIALKKVIERIEFLNSFKIAISYLTAEDFAELSSKNVEYLSNFLRSIEGVKVACLVKEVEKGTIGVSLRSKAPVEVLGFAKSMGGGGHLYASGFRVRGVSLEKFVKELKEKLRSWYGEL